MSKRYKDINPENIYVFSKFYKDVYKNAEQVLLKFPK